MQLSYPIGYYEGSMSALVSRLEKIRAESGCETMKEFHDRLVSHPPVDPDAPSRPDPAATVVGEPSPGLYKYPYSGTAKIFSGQTGRPPAHYLAQVADTFGYSVEWVITGRGAETKAALEVELLREASVRRATLTASARDPEVADLLQHYDAAAREGFWKLLDLIVALREIDGRTTPPIARLAKDLLHELQSPFHFIWDHALAPPEPGGTTWHLTPEQAGDLRQAVVTAMLAGITQAVRAHVDSGLFHQNRP